MTNPETMDKVYSPRTLGVAWERVAANKGAAGVDRISVERFAMKAEQYLRELSEELRTKRYRPEAVRRTYIPKGPGQTRPLGIPTVKDRVMQTALKLVLEPIFGQEFLPVSYGFRPGRGCKDALREVDRSLKEGYTWVVDADLKSHFDTIPHEQLLARLKDRRGGFNYFKHAHRYMYKPIDGLIRRRLRAILRKQNKRPGFGRCHADRRRWPNAFFANLGLFTLYGAHCHASQPR